MMRVDISVDKELDALRIDTRDRSWVAVISLQQSRAKIARELVDVVLRLLKVKGVQ